jgi:hypothetical protein
MRAFVRQNAAAMIISASYRTDVPAYYRDWFLNRLAAGYAEVRNPYSGKVARVSLAADDVSGFVFWTRNPAPFTGGFEAVAARGTPFTIQMTITGYPRALEPGVLDTNAAIAAFRDLAKTWGPRAAVWRYDPVLISDITNTDWHLQNFAKLGAALEGATDEVVLRHAHIYRKTARNLDKAAEVAKFSWQDPTDEAKRTFLANLAEIAGAHGMAPSLCAQPDLLSDSLAPARCIDAKRLSDVAGVRIRSRQRGQRPGCLCAEARDIGRYDTCAQGCAYCYANQSRAAAARNVQDHHPLSESL